MRRASAFTVLLFAAFAFAFASAAEGEGAPKPPAGYTAPALTSAPVIDGNLEDACWAAAAWTEPFGAFKGERSSPHPGRAKIAWDFHALYIAFETADPDIHARPRERDDAIWDDDCVELFLDAAGRGDHYIELGVSAANSIHDYLVVRREGKSEPGRFTDITLRGLRTAAAKRKEGGWCVEMALPWYAIPSAVHTPPRKEDVWCFNFVRCDVNNSGATYATLAPLERRHQPQKFLELTFDPAPAERAAEAAKAAARKALEAGEDAAWVWRLGEHLEEARIDSELLGAFRKTRRGYLAPKEGSFGKIAQLEPADLSPKAVVFAHPADGEFPHDTYDTVRVALPALQATHARLWYRIDPAKKAALAAEQADGAGVSIEIREPAQENAPAAWRKLLEVHAVSTEWSLREIEFPKGASLRLGVDRGPVTLYNDHCQLAFEADGAPAPVEAPNKP
ncbi:MAG: carbohydrate-binding family 9-like protein [Planctomycetes bacterium]|nr:carbohydrate-binding family 9-like protein [Planctomycetota bacterium]